MKRLNWLKKLGLIGGVAGATLPAILTSTACTSINPTVDVFDFKTVVGIEDATKAAESVKNYKTSVDNLLYGSIGNHNGNYILFVGSNTDSSIVNWFSYDSGARGRDQWWGEEFWKTPFYKALKKVMLDDKIKSEGIKECGIYCAIDFFDFKFYDKTGHEIYISKDGTTRVDTIKPFDKWTDAMISQTKIFNKNLEGDQKYDWDSDSVTKNDYIRQDDSAVAYRALVKRGKELYPKNNNRKETFDDSDKNVAKMVIFKNGKIVSIDNVPSGTTSAGIDAFVKIMVDNYKVAKDEEKKQ